MSGLAPPSTRYVVELTRVNTFARPPFGVAIIPRSSPLHGDASAGAAARVNVLRLKSNPASKAEGFHSPMKSGSNVEASVANRDWMLLGGSLPL